MSGQEAIIRDETGSQRLLGYVIHVGPGDGTARVTMTISDEHLNRQDVLHGGLSALLLDTAMGAAASSTHSADARQRFSTLSLTANFLAPGQPGLVEAVARVTGGGRRTVFAEGTLRHVDNNIIIATATGVFQRAKSSEDT